jgi:hypothetical protein
VDNSQSSDNSSQRRYIYRVVDPAPQHSHPMRRCTDRQSAAAVVARELGPRVSTIKMRVYYKLN